MSMEIYFDDHFLDRYKERMGGIDRSVKDDNIDIENLKKKIKKDIKRRGVFYKDPEGKLSFYCVVGNLQVYRGYTGGNALILTTCYPYEKSLRCLLSKAKRLEFPDL